MFTQCFNPHLFFNHQLALSQAAAASSFSLPPSPISTSLLTAQCILQHYPNRLAEAYVVGPSRILNWAWRISSSAVPATTGAKVKQVEMGDPSLPLPSAALDLPPHQPPAAPKAR